jgi:hypothetical protein
VAYRIHGIGTDIHGDVCISVIDDAGAPTLLVTAQVFDGRSVEEAEKLARVAAEGLSMLEALREIVKGCNCDGYDWCGCHVQIAEDAIAKAEGKKD